MSPSRLGILRLALLAAALSCGLLCGAGPVAAAATPAAPCPADISRSPSVPEGCPCIPANGTEFGACGSGFVCSQPWALQVAAAKQKARRLLATDAGSASADASLVPEDPFQDVPSATGAPAGANGFVCMACSYGQLCRRGSALPSVLDPSIQIAIDALACPAGSYCPTPAAAITCQAGFWCPKATIQPVTCNMSLLVAAAPMMPVAYKPATVAQRVYVFGDPLQGNSCPANATNPSELCPEGSYCPEPALKYACPAGYFCKAGSLQPQPCPFLTNCPEGSASADLSYSGFVILAVLLVMMWACYALLTTLVKLNQKRLVRQQEVQDRLWKVLHPLLGGGGGGRGGAPGRGQSFRAFRGVRPRLTLQFEGLGFGLHDGRQILSGVTGRFEHGRVAAVMGPSGAGKTTFLNVIMGKAGLSGAGLQQGRLLVNGREMKLEALRSITGFVPQEDVVHEDLTVRENLVYSARLRLSAGKPLAEQLALVEDCMDLLHLRRVQHQVVGSQERRGISGGQRKRVNIGIELAAKPSLLFMDEPTSGLDSTAAADILGALTRMARLGMNIVTVIHQPRYSIFRKLDDVLLLGNGGRQVFLGPSRLALPYFESIGFALPPHENPADFAMDIISGHVARVDGSPFQPADLHTLWLSHGCSWVQLHTRLPAKDDEQDHLADEQERKQQQCGVDNEQLLLLEQQFDAQDSDGNGALDAAGLLGLLEGLGLEPTQQSVAALMAELSVPRTGLIGKQAFLQYVQNGGRPAGAVPPSTIRASQRRVDSMYRVYSIEQYTLASALSELAASALTPGMLQGSASLREQAVAHHGQQQTEAAAGRVQAAGAAAGDAKQQPRLATAGSSGSSASSAAASVGRMQQQLPASGSGSGSSSADAHRRLSSQESPVSVRLPQATPFSQDAAQHAQAGTTPATPPLPAGYQRQDALKMLPASVAGSAASSSPKQQQPMLVDVQQAEAEPRGLLSCLGLAGSRPLRATPGPAAQFGTLLFRSSIKWTRNWSGKMLELLLLVLAGVVFGVMHGTGGSERAARGNNAMAFLCLGVLSGATSLNVFGFGARVVWWREQERGIRPLSYFLAATAVNLIDVFVQPAVFLSIYYSMTLPALPFTHLYGVGVLVVWYCTSLGTLMSLLAPPASCLLATVALIMIAGGLLNGVNPNYGDMAPALRGITSISFNRWAVEIVNIEQFAYLPEWRWPAAKAAMSWAGYCGLHEIEPIPEDSSVLAQVDKEQMLDIRVYCDNAVPNAVLVLLALGCILRILTALAVAFCPRGIRLEAGLSAVLRHLTGGSRRRRAAQHQRQEQQEQQLRAAP